MCYDREGFLYPTIDERKCSNCGQCVKSCASLNPVFSNTPEPECYAVWADDQIRKVSSSGGMFSLVADYMLDKGGYVCGAAYADDFLSVKHIIISNKNDLSKLRGSKYVQSDTGTVYKEIKAILDADKHVLFSGCPCQVAGLYAYLGKDYDNLITLDLVCHGVNSVRAYRKFLEECSQGRTIKRVSFREKNVYGWSSSTLIHFADDSVFQNHASNCNWYKGFLQGIINRPICGYCPYAKTPRQSDMTIADFWQIHKYDPKLDDRKGTSLVLINSHKGRSVFELIGSKMKLWERVPLEFAKQHNGQLCRPHKPHLHRDRFFKLIDQHGYNKSINYTIDHKFDIGVMGWWYNINYGGVITYFALHQTLKTMGYEILMIDRPDNKNSGHYSTKDTMPRRFAKKHYVISKHYSCKDLNVLNSHCDVFILGSDQMWNYWLHSFSGLAFFLNFAAEDKKKIAYAASFGNRYVIPEQWRLQTSFFMQRIDYVSVREDYAVDICEKYYDVKAKWVLDPVFLCDFNRYNEIAQNTKSKEHGDYLFAYILDPRADKQRLITKLSQKLAIKPIIVLDANISKNNEWVNLRDVEKHVDMEDWLYYIKNCKYIVTDSYHGVCFSIIFKKPFVCIANFKRGIERFVSLLTLLGLTDRLVYDLDDIDRNIYSTDPIDYKSIYETLDKEISASLKWLKSALEAKKERRASAYDILSRENDALRNRLDQLEKDINCLLKRRSPSPRKKIYTKIEKFHNCMREEGLQCALQKTVNYIKKWFSP